jgi:drug/metabolite transporter (DMT)-like permease
MPTLAISALLGCIGAGAYLSYFTGLRIGPIAVVSGVVAAYGGLTVVLAVVLRHETLTLPQALGATVATIGVLLTGIAFEGGWRSTRFASPGVIFSVIALMLFAMMAITTDIALESAGWIQVLLVSRIVTAAIAITTVLGLALLARRRATDGAVPEPGEVATIDEPLAHRGRIIAAVLAAGLLDVLGLISFSIGLANAPTWMVGLASSFGPAITILVAVAFLGERLRPIQWVGLVGVAIGMIAIGLP